MQDESTTAVNTDPDFGIGAGCILSGDVMAQGRYSETVFQHSHVTSPILDTGVVTILNFPVRQVRQ